MSVGNSGRLVIEIEPAVKRELYQALARDGKHLKTWFLEHVEKYLTDGQQLALELPEVVERRAGK